MHKWLRASRNRSPFNTRMSRFQGTHLSTHSRQHVEYCHWAVRKTLFSLATEMEL